ncbi:Zn finger protein [Thermoproteus tenax Kra 1]|uniref:Zn finger protein n=1 Tax=Thermoproteus tenax (strain ATCC 35583 / DSM 2078 / JCM 9277 / NBRC 100435 / Kra 1) TaxID=768679 RepID=G4RPS9_THETK|nr:Zn finger protein [Thermoproteus tenax Kra 1]
MYSSSPVSHKDLCEICGWERADFRCPKCGRLVCRYDKGARYCRACEETLCEICGDAYSIATCYRCGKLVCDKCSVRRGLLRICVECLRAETKPS